jgi:hypothetical protein
MADDLVKCRVSGGLLVEACKTLQDVTENRSPNAKKKGVFMWEWYQIGADVPKKRFFGAKSGAHVERGIVFSFCPFCGESIGPRAIAAQEPRNG